jgi:hypothetical protein
MQPLCKEIRTFAVGCEHLIAREPTPVLTDDEYSLLTFYIAELQAILKVRRTRVDALLISLNNVSTLRNG